MSSFKRTIILGSADEGPDSTPMLLNSIIEIENTFGWWQKEYQNVFSETASAVTTYPVWGGQIEAYKKVGANLYPDVLYQLSPQDSGTYLTFGNPGVSGFFLFKYLKSPDMGNLVWASKIVTQQGAAIPWVYKIPGNKANIQIGDLLLQAEYSGTKHNDIRIVVTANDLTIYYTVDYSATGSVSYSKNQPGVSLVSGINSDNYFGRHPLMGFCNALNPGIPSGTYYTSGGTNGILNASTVVDALSTLDLDTTGVILLAGNPSTGTILAALGYLANFGQNIGPVCLIASTSSETYDTTAEDYYNYLKALPFKLSKLYLVPGWGTSYLSEVNPTWVPLSHVFTGTMSANISAPTNKKSTVDNIKPIWNADQLHSLGNNYCVFNKYIINSFSPWRSCPTNGENPLVNKIRIDIAERLVDTLEYLIGEPEVSVTTVYDLTAKALEGLPNVRKLDYTCEVGPYYIKINIQALAFGELQYININLVSKKPS